MAFVTPVVEHRSEQEIAQWAAEKGCNPILERPPVYSLINKISQTTY